jgi:hypothetical protein
MIPVKLSALVLAMVLGMAVGAAASDHDHRADHHQFERHEHHEQVRNPDRERWAREHRNDQHRDLELERREREAMHRWDREHHKRPMAVKHDPKHEGWDHGKKTGWHEQPSPKGPYQRREAKHHDRRVPPNQQVMNRPPHEMRTVPVAR